MRFSHLVLLKTQAGYLTPLGLEENQVGSDGLPGEPNLGSDGFPEDDRLANDGLPGDDHSGSCGLPEEGLIGAGKLTFYKGGSQWK